MPLSLERKAILERLGARVTAPLPAKVMANLLIKKRRTGLGHRRKKRIQTMSKQLTIEFELGDRVLIKEIQRPGRVEMIQHDLLGITYRVAYWDNSKRETVWLYADELEAR